MSPYHKALLPTMKILTIGIDGADKGIIQAMPMPYMHEILALNESLEIEEDLWSRGWAKILCGADGLESGAFYTKLTLDGSHNTTQKFSIHDYAANSSLKPLWSYLDENGYRSGFMNVPSMMPAPKINGFAISGGGAGANSDIISSITTKACYPQFTREFLNNHNYITDMRFLSSGIRDADLFIDSLLKMTDIRTVAFARLAKQFHIDFGFVAFMALCRIQYLAMSEIEILLKHNRLPQNRFQEKLLNFYTKFDQYVGKLIAQLSPNHLVIVSDHGQSAKLYSINTNKWLQNHSYQTSLPERRNPINLNKIVKASAKILPKKLKNYIKSAAPNLKQKFSDLNVDWAHTKAFSVRYIPGIFINDLNRFSGTVKDSDESQILIDDIILHFNKNKEVIQHHLYARRYRHNFPNSTYQSILPDIWIDHPDTFFFEQHGPFIEHNKNYGPIKNLCDVHTDMFTGIKGRHPLLVVDPALANLVKNRDKKDLTLTYKLIIRGMSL